MLTLNDGRSELWQWDTGRTLAVDADCSQVHFSNKVFGRSIDVNVTDGVAIIPDILLQTDKDLNVWAFVGTTENGYTKISKTFKVNRRNKPADYVFAPTDQMTLQTIQRQIGDLADLTTEAKENLVAAINEAAASGGSGSMDLRVADGYVQYSTDGGSTWENLIAIAELKGDKGDPGTAGKDGHSPVVTATKSGKTTTISVDGAAIATVEDGADGAPGKDGAGMDITGARVGQIAKIAAVDAYGVPAAWSPADMPSGGSSDFVITGTVTGETLTTDKTYEQVQEAVQAGKRVTLKVKVYGIDFVLSQIGKSSIGYLFATAATIVPGLIAQFTAAVGEAGQNLFVNANVVSYDSDGNMMQATMDSDPSQPMEIATKQYVDAAGVPSVTSADNGKVLRVVNGAWAADAINDANGVSF